MTASSGAVEGDRQGAEPIIEIPVEVWARFLDEVAGRRPIGSNGELLATELPSGDVELRSAASGTLLRFTPAEWEAFRLGVLDGEFDPVETPVAD